LQQDLWEALVTTMAVNLQIGGMDLSSTGALSSSWHVMLQPSLSSDFQKYNSKEKFLPE
jgi:hypothetical protein